MTLASINSLILASALAIAPFTANAFTANESDNAHRDNVIQLSVDANGNYHISFFANELEPLTAAQENQERALHRSSVLMRKDGRLTTTDERIDDFISAVKYLSKERPRSFSLKPFGELSETDEYGKIQSYAFCIYFENPRKSSSCSHFWFSANEVHLTSAFDAAEIKYERIDKASDISGGSDNYG
ncbi:hypothetical protein CWE13_07220 [Aliidiomarina shirensis]|uniref:Uncharacterized protein n=1 Tax=Aliidiomarina shirensis TaxID=1048642 RepID=A0A432WVF2_9GAMM|nr:hypothetical protein [Aliidiomarina shirensis]RUO37729.1 hypothetical protein CWE13_07220 [Aliidiomarina shirensis]